MTLAVSTYLISFSIRFICIIMHIIYKTWGFQAVKTHTVVYRVKEAYSLLSGY
jgi:hypothetical protein